MLLSASAYIRANISTNKTIISAVADKALVLVVVAFFYVVVKSSQNLVVVAIPSKQRPDQIEEKKPCRWSCPARMERVRSTP